MNWQPGDDFYIRFTDKTGDPRSEDQLREMIENFRGPAAELGFSVQTYGNWQSGRKVALKEQEVMAKNDTIILLSHILEAGKRIIQNTSLKNVDYVTKLFYDLLCEFNADAEAAELCEFYEATWG